MLGLVHAVIYYWSALHTVQGARLVMLSGVCRRL